MKNKTFPICQNSFDQTCTCARGQAVNGIRGFKGGWVLQCSNFVSAESVVEPIADGYSWYGLSDDDNGRGPDLQWDGSSEQFMVGMNNDCNGELFGCKYQVAYTTLVRNYKLTDCWGWDLIGNQGDSAFIYNTVTRVIAGLKYQKVGRQPAYWSAKTCKIEKV